MSKKLVIFDLDGTLINSVADLGNACNHALAAMGFPTHPKGVYNNMVGNGISKLIERSLPEEARRQRVIEAMKVKFMEYYDEHLWEETEPYAGITELLDELASMGVKLAVASNKYQAATKALVEHFFGFLPWVSVRGQEEMVPLKPDPSIVFNILTDSPTPKAGVLYVGDSGVDIETAYRACVESVAVTWGFRSHSELIAKHPDHIVNEPYEILCIVNGDIAGEDS